MEMSFSEVFKIERRIIANQQFVLRYAIFLRPDFVLFSFSGAAQ
jgi:hypothetical protein